MKQDTYEALVGIGLGLVIALLVFLGVISSWTAIIIGLGTVVFSFVLILAVTVVATMKEK
jgi:hypothetical protein